MLFLKERRFFLTIGQIIFLKPKDAMFGYRWKKYIDISLMGVGTNILGYANSKIDRK